MNTKLQTQETRAKAGKFLTFILGSETYGISIDFVREILSLPAITAVPQTPRFIKGVTNLRGKIISLVDLRIKLGVEASEFTRQTCIVVVDVPGITGRMQIGVIVDAVQDVLIVSETELDDVPSFGIRVNTSFLLGLAHSKAGLCLLLDIEKVLSCNDIAIVNTVVSDAAEARSGDQEFLNSQHDDADINAGEYIP